MEKGISEEILKAVKSVKFGNVQIIIQDSKVVQIDKTEKIRLGQNCKKGGEA
ncbi:MAG: YezD family protein [Thermodesulfobacteriota bacterium]|nr:MAG: YezD family protein [Thermodesulfobacteriota bacterium]